MERVKDISKLKLSAGYVLIKLNFKNSPILAPGSMSKNNEQLSHAEVVAYGATVEDLTIGDIVLDFTSKEGFEWEGDKYTIIARMNIRIVTSKSNFDNGKKGKARIELKN